jgi:polyhydroxyalkanoate synthesis regulator phasin
MQPSFAQAFGGIDSASVQGFGQQWQHWLQAAQPAGFFDPRGLSSLPAFGYTREQQEQQQALQQAILDHLEASKRYHELMLRAQTQGVERLQQKLAGYIDSNQQVESLKALYDLWIDSAEEAYAEIALSDEFREVYGAQVNTQMRVRQLQKEQLEQVCRQLGMPTASEVDSLGKRLQELRRELRELKQQAAARPSPVATADAAEPTASPRRKAAAKASPRPARSATPTGKSSARATPRKRS